jgi:hypothetical protein
MDANPEQQPSKQPADQQPYIGEEALRLLARMIARRLLAERIRRVGILSDSQPGTLPEGFDTPLKDQTQGKEGNK